MTTFLLSLAVILPLQQSNSYLIQSDEPFGPSSTVKLEFNGQKIETGILNGVEYRIYYSDGSGSFVGRRGGNLADVMSFQYNWHVSCRKDVITDGKSCFMNRGATFVFVDDTGAYNLHLGTDHYPGSDIVIRIDNGKPIFMNSRTSTGSFGPRLSAAIIQSISKAKTVTTRYYKWPRNLPLDATWEPYGFNEALAYIKWAASRIR